MLTSIARKIVNSVFSNGSLEEEYEELFIYGLYILLSNIYMFTIIVIVGIYFDLFYKSILYFLFFTFLRRYFGGFHAKKEKYCLYITALFSVCSIRIIKILDSYIPTNYSIIVIVICSLLLITYNNNRNIPAYITVTIVAVLGISFRFFTAVSAVGLFSVQVSLFIDHFTRAKI